MRIVRAESMLIECVRAEPTMSARLGALFGEHGGQLIAC